MQRITQRLWLAVTVALVLVAEVLLYPTPAGATTDTLDQSTQTSTWTADWLINGGTVPPITQIAQIVTAGAYGTLDRVSLPLNNVDATGPVSVSIQTVIGGAPSGIEIGSGEIPVIELPPQGTFQYVDAYIYGSAFVEPGMQFAIVVSSGGGAIQWYSCADSVYKGGSMLYSFGSGWSSFAADAMFKTYVVSDKCDLNQTDWTFTVDFCYYCQRSGYRLFTPKMSGALDRLNLGTGEVYQPNTDFIQISIQTTVNGAPSGKEIGHGGINAGAVPVVDYNWWSQAEIKPDSTAAVMVTAGTQYAIVVTTSSELWWFVNALQTYVASPIVLAGAPPPAGITPCSDGVCPALDGWIRPMDSTALVRSFFRFHERPDGKVYGILDFDNSRTGNFVLEGSTSEWDARQFSVTTFACTDEHAITVAGRYTPKGGTSTPYQLTLSGVRDRLGTFTLTAGSYTYSLSRNGIVDVRCPPTP